MKVYIKASDTSFLISVKELFDMLDDCISNDNEGNADVVVCANSPTVSKVMITTQFKKNLKVLQAKHRVDELKKLREIFEKLCKYEITTQSKNHRLTSQNNKNGLSDIHIDGDIILLYRYVASDMLAFDLELTNLTNHRDLTNTTHQIWRGVQLAIVLLYTPPLLLNLVGTRQLLGWCFMLYTKGMVL